MCVDIRIHNKHINIICVPFFRLMRSTTTFMGFALGLRPRFFFVAGLKPTGAGRSKVQTSRVTARIRDAAA